MTVFESLVFLLRLSVQAHPVSINHCSCTRTHAHQLTRVILFFCLLNYKTILYFSDGVVNFHAFTRKDSMAVILSQPGPEVCCVQRECRE